MTPCPQLAAAQWYAHALSPRVNRSRTLNAYLIRCFNGISRFEILLTISKYYYFFIDLTVMVDSCARHGG